MLAVVALFLATSLAQANPGAQKTFMVVVPNDGPNGHYSVEVQEGTKWRVVGKLQYGKLFTGESLDITGLDANKEIILRLTQSGGGMAHIDVVTLGGVAPAKVTGSPSPAKKFIKQDNDVADSTAATMTFTFPAKGRSGATLAMNARIEPEVISKHPFQYPAANNYREVKPDSAFLTYKLDSVKGALTMKGDTSQLEEEKEFFSEFGVAGTGHPAAVNSGWVRNDQENLYVAIDFAVDNTMDGDVDYGRVYVNLGDEVKEYEVRQSKQKYGKASFVYSKKVPYQHKFYEIAIPLDEIGGYQPEREVKLAFALYGTAAMIDPLADMTFGPIAAGTTQSKTINVSGDNGCCDSNVTCTLTGPDAALFSCSSPAPFTAAFNLFSTTFTIIFSPTTGGTFSAQAIFDVNRVSDGTSAIWPGPVTINLTGTATLKPITINVDVEDGEGGKTTQSVTLQPVP